MYYLEQLYNLTNGKVECMLLSETEASALGYDGDYTANHPLGKIYVDEFDDIESVDAHVRSLSEMENVTYRKLV